MIVLPYSMWVIGVTARGVRKIIYSIEVGTNEVRMVTLGLSRWRTLRTQKTVPDQRTRAYLVKGRRNQIPCEWVKQPELTMLVGWRVSSG